ncbi:MAG TPA: glycosyltransferase family 4 protein [Gemmatimonadaceae bacterium]|nr:glycosyltransferase family 4 protein [Gemmatimonadaceae bacterium]
MTPLRFAYVTTFYPPHNFGGDGIGVQRWARALARRGHHVTVICDTDVYDLLRSGAGPATVTEEEGITVHRLRSSIGPLSVLLTHQMGRPVVNSAAIRRILDEGHFDVINFHNVSAIGGPGVLEMGRGIKLYTAWEHWLVCPTHVLWRHNREVCTGRECLQCVLHYHRPPQLWRHTGVLERSLRHIDSFIALSEFSRQKHREFGFPHDMEVLPGFLPDPAPGAMRPMAGGTSPHERPYFLFVGRLERIKGLDDVIPVFARYLEADLIIAGDGTDRQRLEMIAARNPRVRFLGTISQPDVGRYNAHAIASLVPTAGFETFGFVVIEAFRRGTPVIARRIGPLPELVDACGGGETFRSPDELEATLRRMQHEPGYRERLAAAAYRGFTDRWTESAVMPLFFRLLKRVAQDRGAMEIVRALDAGRAA